MLIDTNPGSSHWCRNRKGLHNDGVTGRKHKTLSLEMLLKYEASTLCTATVAYKLCTFLASLWTRDLAILPLLYPSEWSGSTYQDNGERGWSVSQMYVIYAPRTLPVVKSWFVALPLQYLTSRKASNALDFGAGLPIA